MGLDGHDHPGVSGNRSVVRLLPEIADTLPAITRAPLTGRDPEWRRIEMNPLPAKLGDLRKRVRMTWRWIWRSCLSRSAPGPG